MSSPRRMNWLVRTRTRSDISGVCMPPIPVLWTWKASYGVSARADIGAAGTATPSILSAIGPGSAISLRYGPAAQKAELSRARFHVPFEGIARGGMALGPGGTQLFIGV